MARQIANKQRPPIQNGPSAGEFAGQALCTSLANIPNLTGTERALFSCVEKMVMELSNLRKELQEKEKTNGELTQQNELLSMELAKKEWELAKLQNEISKGRGMSRESAEVEMTTQERSISKRIKWEAQIGSNQAGSSSSQIPQNQLNNGLQNNVLQIAGFPQFSSSNFGDQRFNGMQNNEFYEEGDEREESEESVIDEQDCPMSKQKMWRSPKYSKLFTQIKFNGKFTNELECQKCHKILNMNSRTSIRKHFKMHQNNRRNEAMPAGNLATMRK